MEIGFMVYKDGGMLPTKMHPTLKDAQEEAQRLAEKEPGDKFHIYGSVDVVKVDAPIIHIGSKVTVHNDHESSIGPLVICKVIEILPDGRIGFRPLTTSYTEAKNLKLSRLDKS